MARHVERPPEVFELMEEQVCGPSRTEQNGQGVEARVIQRRIPRHPLSRVVAGWALAIGLTAIACSDPSSDSDRGSRSTSRPGAESPIGSAPADFTCDGCNVILVVSDTMRAQQLGLYGYERDTSPFLDGLGEDGAYFAHAMSQAACTYPSGHSILTSRYPFNFLGKQTNNIPPEIPMISEIFSEHGYRTVGISGSPIIVQEQNEFSNGGFDRGFDVWEKCECLGPGCTWKFTPHADCINGHAIREIEAARDEPLFLYLHYMDAHTPLLAPETTFSKAYKGNKDWISGGVMNPLERMIYSGGEAITLDPGDIEHLRDLYDDEVRYFDSALGSLLEALDDRGMTNDSIVVVAADHGEEFLEHESVKHCHTLYDTETATPLIIRIPGVRAGRIEHVVENNDILPTLLDYVGIDTSAYAFDGVSLRPSLTGGPPPRAFAFSSQNELRALSTGRYHLIYDIGTKEARLFDRDAGDGETRDQFDPTLEEHATLLGVLQRWLASVEGMKSEGDLEKARDVSNQTLDHLRTIGYIE